MPVSSSEAGARAGIRLINSRGAARRQTREGDKKNIWDRAVIGDLIHFARAFDERIPGAARFDHALAANRFVNGERSLLDDDDRAAWMGVPAGGATGVNR